MSLAEENAPNPEMCCAGCISSSWKSWSCVVPGIEAQFTSMELPFTSFQICLAELYPWDIKWNLYWIRLGTVAAHVWNYPFGLTIRLCNDSIFVNDHSQLPDVFHFLDTKRIDLPDWLALDTIPNGPSIPLRNRSSTRNNSRLPPTGPYSRELWIDLCAATNLLLSCYHAPFIDNVWVTSHSFNRRPYHLAILFFVGNKAYLYRWISSILACTILQQLAHLGERFMWFLSLYMLCHWADS